MNGANHVTPSLRDAANRYSVGVEFIVLAESEDEAVALVANFADGFPSQVDDWRDGDVIVQDATLGEAGVEVERD